jgi:hypothetical protein
MATIRFSNSQKEILISIAKTERNARRYELKEEENDWFTWRFPPEDDASLLEIEEMTLESFAKNYPKACEIINAKVKQQASIQRSYDFDGVASELTIACALWEEKILETKRVAFKI